jgi:hypothetical protein
MPTQAYITIEDFSKEKSTVRFWVQDISSSNYDSVVTDIDEVKNSILTVIDGEVRVAGFSKTYPNSATAVTDPNAQRESKWLVSYRDTSQFLDVANAVANPGYLKLFSAEIGTADNDLLTTAGSDDLDLVDGGVVAAFVASWEANVRSPYNHSANAPSISVERITLVGRAI